MDVIGTLITYVDGIQIAVTEHGVKLLIQAAEPEIGGTPGTDGQLQMRMKIMAVLNMSHEHLKLFTIFAHRQLSAYEKENTEIPLNKKVLEAQKIDLKAEW